MPKSTPGRRHPIDRCKTFELVTEPNEPPRARVTCSTKGCEEFFDHSLNRVNTPPHVIANWARQAGWEVKGEGKKAVCPVCQDAKRQRKGSGPEIAEPKEVATLHQVPDDVLHPDGFGGEDFPTFTAVEDAVEEAAAETIGLDDLDAEHEPQPEPQPEPPMNSAANAPAEPPVPETTAAIKNQRKLFRMLEEHFDPEHHCYVNGYSDDRLAEECDLSLHYVKTVREDGWGSLDDPLLRRIEEKVNKARRRHMQEWEEIKSLVSDTKERQENELAALQREVRMAKEGRKV